MSDTENRESIAALWDTWRDRARDAYRDADGGAPEWEVDQAINAILRHGLQTQKFPQRTSLADVDQEYAALRIATLGEVAAVLADALHKDWEGPETPSPMEGAGMTQTPNESGGLDIASQGVKVCTITPLVDIDDPAKDGIRAARAEAYQRAQEERDYIIQEAENTRAVAVRAAEEQWQLFCNKQETLRNLEAARDSLEKAISLTRDGTVQHVVDTMLERLHQLLLDAEWMTNG